MSNAEFEETLKRIAAHKGVIGTMVINSEKTPIKTTMDNTKSNLYAILISELCEKARSVVRDLDPTNELTFLRVRTRKEEILIATENKEYALIVIQTPSDEKEKS